MQHICYICTSHTTTYKQNILLLDARVCTWFVYSFSSTTGFVYSFSSTTGFVYSFSSTTGFVYSFFAYYWFRLLLFRLLLLLYVSIYMLVTASIFMLLGSVVQKKKKGNEQVKLKTEPSTYSPKIFD